MHNYTIYFKKKPGFERFIRKLYIKYKTMAKFSGTIKLESITLTEAKDLSRFFGISYIEGETISISIKKFVSIMNNSKYVDFDINTLVKEYLNVELITNKQMKEINEFDELSFYQNIIINNTGIGKKWLKEVVSSKKDPYQLLHQRYNKDKSSLKKELINIITFVNNLPKDKVLLSIYASTYTADPHYLDLDTGHSNLFLYAICYIRNLDYPNTREEKIKILSSCNIEMDNLSNYVLTYNLLSDKKNINMFSQNKESLILNIQNIINTNSFYTKNNKVYIFENPSILTEIISKNIDVAVIISGGFPNASIYLLIDKLLETNNKLYYNGDFDPEGLLIANKLKEKYQDNLTLFCYDEIDYFTCISKKKISVNRLKKLLKVNVKELMIMKCLLNVNMYSAYQENNKERIFSFINNNK